MTDAEFFHYWEKIHGPIGAHIPGLRKLVQSHRIDVPGDGRAPNLDGAAELWFDDMPALLATQKPPERRATSEDEANFIDHRKFAYFISDEHIISVGGES